jgi:hypothetical protein
MINKTKHMSKDLSYLHDWVFHYNTYTNEWAAVPRETYNAYWSDRNAHGVIRSNELNTLLEMLHKTDGDISKISEHFNIEYE